MSKFLLLTSFGVALLLVVGCGSQPVTIGLITPLSGNNAADGAELKRAAELATDHFLVDGKKVVVKVGDGACNAATSTATATELVEKDIKYILGGYCSGETLGAATVTEPANVILLSGSSTSPQITDVGDFVFRTSAPGTQRGTVMANLANSLGYKRLFVVHESTPYATDLANVFRNRVTEHGIELAGFETYPQNDPDFSAIIAKLRTADFDALYFVPQSLHNGEKFGEALQATNISVQILGNQILFSPTIARTGGPFANIYVAEVLLEEDAPLIAEFKQRWREKYGEEVMPTTATLFHYLTHYEGVKLITELIERCGDNTACARDHLYSIRNRETSFGTYSFDNNGDPFGFRFGIYRLQGNNFELIDTVLTGTTAP